MREHKEVLETQAVELPAEEPGAGEDDLEARPLPAPADGTDMIVWGSEVKSAALAAAGGLVAGAATVAVVRATRAGTTKRRRRGMLRRERPQQVIASRSFLVDVHLLGQK